MITLRPGRRWITTGFVALGGFALAGAGGAQAQGNEAWFGFHSNVSSGASYDRQFVRKWEANPPKGYPTLSPSNIAATKTAIRRYQTIVKRGGWKPVPGKTLERGSSGPAVAILRKRLELSGDLKQKSGYATSYDYYVEKAVKRFQASNGLTPTGIVDRRTRMALNVPASARLRQLKLGLSRLRTLTSGTSKKKYVLVNIPAAQVEAVEGDRVVSRHSGVVGKIDRKTPILKSRIHELNFNPVWRLPPTVIRKDLIPKGRSMQRKGKSVLSKYGIDAYDGAGRKVDPKKVNWNSNQPNTLSYRQKPGKDNPLGFVKINFPNAHSVYMHDTPSDTIFGRNFRAASSGCIRVQNIEDLVVWLLDRNDWSRPRVDMMRKSGKSLNAKLDRSIPLYFAYITAWATKDGVVQFRRDLYLKDGVGKMVAAY